MQLFTAYSMQLSTTLILNRFQLMTQEGWRNAMFNGILQCF